MLATIATSYRIPVMRTFSPIETAKLMIAIAKREQGLSQDQFTYHTAKPLLDKELQEYIVSSLPNIGGTLAKSLLEHFDSIQDLANASVDDLQKIPLIGKKKAEEIARVLSLSYQDAKRELNNPQ